MFQHQLSGEREGSSAAAGDVSSHSFSQALCPEVRSSSKSPFQDKISPPLEAAPPDLYCVLLRKEKNVTATKFAVHFWWGSVSLCWLENRLN